VIVGMNLMNERPHGDLLRPRYHRVGIALRVSPMCCRTRMEQEVAKISTTDSAASRTTLFRCVTNFAKLGDSLIIITDLLGDQG
jgi:hypothetical protein